MKIRANQLDLGLFQDAFRTILMFSMIIGVPEMSFAFTTNSLKNPTIEIFSSGDKDLPIETGEILQEYSQSDLGFEVYGMRPHGFPINQEIVFSIKRPALDTDWDEKFTFTIHDNETGVTIKGVKIPFQTVSARGFLPGEQIYLKFESRNGDFFYDFKFIPYPIILKDDSGNITVQATLRIAFPAFYEIKFGKSKRDEEVRIRSRSGSESFDLKQTISEGTFVYSPDTESKPIVSIATLEIWRESGEKIKLLLPWGDIFRHCLTGSKKGYDVFDVNFQRSSSSFHEK